jgi:hypothetical protein
MELQDLTDIAAAAGQVLSALFAIPAILIAVFAWRTSRSAERAATTLTKIEKSRWHAEFYPQFKGRLINLADPDRQPDYILTLELVGPPLLHELHETSIYIQAESHYDKATKQLSERRSFRFLDANLDRSPDGTTARVQTVRRGSTRIFPLEAVRDLRPPAGEKRPARPSVSLYITCVLGEDHWVVPLEVVDEDLFGVFGEVAKLEVSDDAAKPVGSGSSTNS